MPLVNFADQILDLLGIHLMTLKSAGQRVALALALGLWIAADAAAVQVTLNLIQSQSFLTLNGDFGGTDDEPANPFTPQDDPTFPTPSPPDPPDPDRTVIDLDPTRPSNQTTFTGTILVDVDNIMAPTTIQILSADMDATVTGHWLPEAQPPDGAPSDDNPPGPAAPADLGIKLVSFNCCDFAYAVVRDAKYTLVTQTVGDTPTPVVEPVNAQGEFSSYSQNLSYTQGFFEYWVDPFTLNEREQDELAGDDGQNQHVFFNDPAPGETYTPIPNAPKSTYIVSGGVATLTIPIEIDIDQPGDLSQYIDGQFVATFTIPSGPDGDHNEDGVIDAADYVDWRKTPSANGGIPDGYNVWKQNFGDLSPGASGAVPEPAGAVLALIGLIALFFNRGRSSR
jgi:hypothetical protein